MTQRTLVRLPTTIAEILDLSGKVGRDEMRIDEVVDGLIDPNAKDEPIQELADDVEPEEEEETGWRGRDAALSASLLQLKETPSRARQDQPLSYEKMKRSGQTDTAARIHPRRDQIGTS